MKIIDCFIFYNELDMLELRLEELNDVVDYFVLVESIKTFANNDKELYFENNKDRFSKFLNKIIHIIVKYNIPQTSNAWDIESYQRRCIDIGIKQLDLQNDDIVIISDLDELPDVNTLLLIKNDQNINPMTIMTIDGIYRTILKIDGIYRLEQDFYYYNLNCKHKNKWSLAKILNYGSYNNDPQNIRSDAKWKGYIKKGGWHLSYFGDVDFIKNKIKNFSHQELNNEYILNDERILKQIVNNDDLFGRGKNEFDYIDKKDNTYLPQKYKEFEYLLFKKI
jgi:beta-1,4-mannosyl-glycoprotein beta-1,4-N-acetylglucosaminyltransferase